MRKYDIQGVDIFLRLLRAFPGKNWAMTSVDRLLKKTDFTGNDEMSKMSNSTGSVRTWKNIELVKQLICSLESAPHTATKVHFSFQS